MAGLPDAVRDDIAATDLGYDRVDMLQYAKDHWDNEDIDWPDKNNCTNFVSLALEAAGLPFKGTFTLQGDAWGHRLIPDMPIIGDTGGYTDSWGGADAQHDLFVDSGSPEVSIADAKPGDVIYWSQTGDNPDIAKGDEHRSHCPLTAPRR